MTRKLRFRAFPAVLALAALSVFGLTACDGGGRTANAAESIRAASQNSTDAGTVSFEMSIELSGAPGAAFETKAEGVYDFDNGQMQMALDLLGQEITAVMDGNTMYMKMPFTGDKWVKQDLTELTGGNPLEGGAQDPTQVLSWLMGAGEDVEDLGEAEVRGETVRRYRALVNLRDALEQFDGEQRENMEMALEALGQDEVEIDVWVNGDALPVRVQYELSFANSDIEALDDAVMKFTMDYFDWGQPVEIEVPDPSEVE